jgi:ribosome maturation factor RimP
VGESPLFYFARSRVMPALEKDRVLANITLLGEQAAEGTGIEIVEIQLRGGGSARLLRVYIDKPGGVTHGDCELISTRIGALLDETDALPGDSYTLEVSSPGIERNLTKPRDFERAVGQKIKLLFHEPLAGKQRLEGTLTAFSGDALELEIEPGSRSRIPLDQIRKANLKFEWRS